MTTTVSVSTALKWLGSPYPAATDLLTPCVNAVLALARRRLTVAPADEWPDDVALGLNMQTARLFKRSLTPEGVSVDGDLGVVITIRRFDPDIENLLGDHMKIGLA